MAVAQHTCPLCNAALRVRTPVRDGESFSCPDCSQDLRFRTGPGETEVVAGQQPRDLKISRHTDPSRRSRLVAWGFSTVLLIVLAVYLAGGTADDAASPGGSVSQSSGNDATRGNEKTPTPDAPTTDTAAPQQPANEIVAAEVGESPGTPDPDAGSDSAEPGSTPAKPTDSALAEQATDIDPAAPVEPSLTEPSTTEPAVTQPPIDPVAAERAAKEQQAIARVREKLDAKLLSYQTPGPVPLGGFLDEVSRLAGTWINTSSVPDTLDKTVSVSLEETTVLEVLEEGLRQSQLHFEIRANGIHLQR